MTDADGPVEYVWALTARPFGSAATVEAPNSPIAFVNADVIGAYAAELVRVVDGIALPAVIVALDTDNLEPVADARTVGGHAPVAENGPVQLSAARSYDQHGGGPLAFDWRVETAPPGSVAAPVDGSAMRTVFTPDLPGDYEISLRVTDNAGAAVVDTLRLSTGAGVIRAEAGPDVSTATGVPVLADAFASTHSGGGQLLSSWSIVSQPAGSVSALENGYTITPSQPGRFRITPDVAGLYVLQADVFGGENPDRDTLVVAAGPDANVRPVANAGADRTAFAGSGVSLDATGSTDGNGDVLSVAWRIVHAPDGSIADLGAPDDPVASFVPDIEGDYLIQLAVSDGKLIDYDTVLVTTGTVPPRAVAGPDEILPVDAIVTVDGRQSAPAGYGPLVYHWSVSNLAAPDAEVIGRIDQPDAAVTAIDFSIDPAAYPNPAHALTEFDLIVFENANMRSQVYGRSFVGGQLNGESSDFGNGLTGGAGGAVILTVGDHINGAPKNVNNGGSVRTGLPPNAIINLNGGGQIIADPAVDIAPLRHEMEVFSTLLRNREATSSSVLPGGQPAPVTLNSVPDSDGIAIFDFARGKDLLDNSKVQSIDIALNGASAVVINVGGKNIHARGANLVGAFGSESVRTRVIWNFYEAVNIQIDRAFFGSVLAPMAMLQNDAPISGAVVTRHINTRAAIATPGFAGALAFADTPDPVRAAVV